MSIYYTARRGQALSAAERATVDKLIAQYAIEDQLAKREQTGVGSNWESFCMYDRDNPTEPGIVFEGATKLPDNSEEAVWDGLQHWCRLLSEIRRALPRTSWHVHVDDHDIPWDAHRGEYDPSQ